MELSYRPSFLTRNRGTDFGGSYYEDLGFWKALHELLSGPARIYNLGLIEFAPVDKLTGDEIKKLLFGHTQTGLGPSGVGEYSMEFSAEGEVSLRGTYRGFQILDPAALATAKIEDDVICVWWKKPRELKECGNILRNPDGMPEEKNEYINVADEGIIYFSVEP